MKSAKKLTEKVKSAFTKKYGRTAVEGAEPTFHTSKTHGGTIPYLPGKFREEFAEDLIENEEKRTTKTRTSTNKKNNNSNTKNQKK
ncbi:MAG: hypothetical protein E7177_05320 [Erysipelotrichaceae bacterium]|nr:hypothetical protein [Erysipelotrichaceae bacterium]